MSFAQRRWSSTRVSPRRSWSASPDVIAQKIETLGLRLQPGRDVQIASFDDQDSIAEAAEAYYQRRKRHGLSRDVAAAEMRRNSTLIGAMLLEAGGWAPVRHVRSLHAHLRYVEEVIGLAEGAHGFAAMSLLQLPRHTVHLRSLRPPRPDGGGDRRNGRGRSGVETLRSDAARRPRRIPTSGPPTMPRHEDAGRARLINRRAPDLEVEGEMHADAAPKPLLNRIFPDAQLSAEANLLIMPNLDAANATFNALKIVAGQGISVGPILLGAAKPVHILTPTATVRGS